MVFPCFDYYGKFTVCEKILSKRRVLKEGESFLKFITRI